MPLEVGVRPDAETMNVFFLLHDRRRESSL
jgi:hypothetical protein